MSSELSASELGQHAAFNPSDSKTFTSLPGESWFISYGDGSEADGTVGRDVVDVGGATATQQAVEVATAVSQSFTADANSDGIMGLAFKQLNTITPTKQSTFFESVMSQLAQPIFSVDLMDNNTGTYEFGAYDSTRFVGQLTTVAINQTTGFWQVPASNFAVAGKTMTNTAASPAILGTPSPCDSSLPFSLANRLPSMQILARLFSSSTPT
jgi:hypothetical protein